MVCPKCGAHISPFDLKPNCSNCSINIMLYTQEQSLIHDAKRAELEFGKARIFVAKLKAAFISGSLAITRMILTILCIGVIAIPFASLKLTLPLCSAEISVGAIGAYKLFDSGTLMSLPAFAGVELFAPAVKIALIMLAVFVLTVLCAGLVLLVELLSFINIHRSAKALCFLSGIGILLSAACAVLSFILKANAGSAVISVSVGLGSFASIIAFAASLAINIIIYYRDLPIKVKEVDVLRAQTLKRIKNGEISYADLPLPVFETPQEREKRLNDYAKGGQTHD